ncbi:MAG: ATP-binding protein, partial [Anaerolineae bacterium]
PGKETRIAVKISRRKEMVLFEFKDNGPGYPAEVLEGQNYSVGLYLVQNITRQQLHGRATFRNRHGAVAAICFPLEATATRLRR